MFTGHGFAEGTDTILNELKRHETHAAFFLTGECVRYRLTSVLETFPGNLMGRRLFGQGVPFRFGFL